MVARTPLHQIILGSSLWTIAQLFAVQAIADVIPDNSLGLESSVMLSDVLIGGDLADEIQGGATRGSNLFHSFTDFSIDAGERIYFANPASIDSIFTRVTGISSSNILGTLGVNGAANLYLFNPNGVYFGDTAYLDIAGAFTATTAEIPFADGFVFGVPANQSAPTLLTVKQPLGLAAWTNPQGEITNRAKLAVGADLTLLGQSLDLENTLAAGGALQLKAANTLQIRDRPDVPFVTLSGGNQTLEAETIDIFALSHPNGGLYSYGDLTLRSPNPIIIDSYFNSLGNFSLENTTGSAGDALSPNDPVIRSSGDVTFATYSGASLHVIAGGSVNVTDSIDIRAPDGTNGLVETLQLSDGQTSVEIDGQNVATLDIRAGVNNAGGDSVTGLFNFPPIPFALPCSSLFCTNATALPAAFTDTLSGFAPTTVVSSADINIGSVTFANAGGNETFAFISNQYDPNTNLSGGDITLGEVVLNTSSERALVVDSRNDIYISGVVEPDNLLIDVGDILLRAESDVFVESLIRNVGDILIYADTLTALDGNQIETRTETMADAGKIFVQANQINFSGTSGSGVFSGLSAQAALGSTGNAGEIEVKVGTLRLSDGAQIRSSTFGAGNAGEILVTATEAIAIDGGIVLGANTVPSGIISEVGESSTGSGQKLDIQAKTLTVTNGGIISAATAGGGNAGELKIAVENRASFDGNPGSPLAPSGVFTESLSTAQGAGGNIDFTAGDLRLTNGATFKSSTQSDNRAGDIEVRVMNDVAIAGAKTGIFADTSSLSEAGTGGKVTVSSQNLSLSDGGRISSMTAGAADAGDIKVDVTTDIDVTGKNSGVFAATSAAASGAGGTIDIDPVNIRLVDGGSFVVDSLGSGRGGDVLVTGDFLVLDHGLISAQATSGQGGNIILNIGQYMTLENTSQIRATAGLGGSGGDGGNIEINSPFIIAFPKDNAIIADAFTGDGGSIEITTNAILGANNLLISASSDFGLDGNVVVNEPDVDPSSGLAKLTTNLGDREDRVVSACATGQELNSFTVTGQGGIPTDPSALVRGSSLLADMRDFSGGQATTEAVQTAIAPEPESELTLRQATHFKVGENGIELAAAEKRVPQKVASNCP